MATELPNARTLQVPVIPVGIKEVAEVLAYLEDLRSSLVVGYTKAFDNSNVVRESVDTAANQALSNLATVLVNTNIDFNKKQGVQFVVENRTDDPSSPVAAQIWFRTDV